MSHYQKPPELYDGLRLHQNENTGGCSPKVIEALGRMRPDQIGFYPPYAAATEAVKLNHEIHGNTVPHLHVHIFPRYVGDAFEGRPIDPRAVREPVYGPGEFTRLRERVVEELMRLSAMR